MAKVNTLLIANRGEIACRIIRTCQEMGIKTVAVYSEADREALHTQMADIAYEIGESAVSKSYLNMDAIFAAALVSGADAIHPGYGLLSENAQFATAVRDKKIVWIGPDPKTITIMGDKERARFLAEKLGVPVLPGSHRFLPNEDNDYQCAADQVGFPLLIKAAGGGGGIGMRVVNDETKLNIQVEATQKLAERTFKDGSIYLERYVPNARHIEVQVFGFGDGSGIHLFDRDCTIQRRFQKVIEEAPAPKIDESLRNDMHRAALLLVESQKYLGAGTVEFIYDCDRNEFYFLEMNTRIQVEHPVTEMITGIDLVRWQIEAASGEFERIAAYSPKMTGHSLECRIYAENPEKKFMPSPGKLSVLRFPAESDHVRVDTGVKEGSVITPFYDPMIAKLVVRGSDRNMALEKMKIALGQTRIEGVHTNISFLLKTLDDQDFESVQFTTNFVQEKAGL